MKSNKYSLIYTIFFTNYKAVTFKSKNTFSIYKL